MVVQLWRHGHCRPSLLFFLIAHLQGHAVLIDLRTVGHGLNKERTVFLLQDLGLNVADVTDILTVLSTQLLCSTAAEPCQAPLAKLQAGIP